MLTFPFTFLGPKRVNVLLLNKFIHISPDSFSENIYSRVKIHEKSKYNNVIEGNFHTPSVSKCKQKWINIFDISSTNFKQNT